MITAPARDDFRDPSIPAALSPAATRDAQQAVRVRRFVMASASYVAGVALMLLAYAFGFLQIASAWLALRRVSTTHTGIDHFGTLVVLVMLATTTLVPFTTGVLADVLHDSEDLGAATRLAGVVVLATSVLFALLVAYLDRRGFVRPDLDMERLTALRRALPLLVALPLLAVLVSYLSPWAGLAMIAAMLLLCLWPLDVHLLPERPNG